jgi:peptidoglycan/xylan/chitin deacetylase (PgdA/CDA1 family)
MYHSVSDERENANPYYRTLTSPSVFADQMNFLHENGYNVIDLMTLVESMSAGRQPAPKSVVLTFDDGYRDFYENAFPILYEHRLPATVFLVTGHIDNGSCLKGKICLSWDQVRELGRHGISFGSHTVNHQVLNALAGKDLDFELTRSKDRIESELGKKVEAFAYPYAFPEQDRAFLQRLKSTLVGTGYKCCLTTRIGTASACDDPFRLKRLPVNSMDDSRLLRAKLEGAYDWLSRLQLSYKRIGRGKQADC